MTLHDLIDFCTTNGVEVSIGSDPRTEFITLKLRRGANFQVDYGVINPDEVINYDVWEESFERILTGMLRQIKEREYRQTHIRDLECRDRQDAQFQRYISDVTRSNQSTQS